MNRNPILISLLTTLANNHHQMIVKKELKLLYAILDSIFL